MPKPSPDTEFCAGFISAQIENTIIANDMPRRDAADYMEQMLHCLKPEIIRSLLFPAPIMLSREGKATCRDILLRGTFKEILDA